MRDTEALGAGDPGALVAMWGSASELGAEIALAEAYRRWGWMSAEIDPLAPPKPAPAALDPATYGLPAGDSAPLHRAYCGTLGWEFGHVQDCAQRDWLAAQAESIDQPAPDARRAALDLIARGELLEAAFDRRMPGTKTFGMSGAESYLVLLRAVLDAGSAAGADHAIMGGMHRGRLTQMGLVFGKPLPRIIADARGVPEFPMDLGASSDSPYHMGWSGQIATASGEMQVWVAPHPSHLSVVAPVGLGHARAAMDGGAAVLPLALHTDAAFAGQGVNAEMLQMARLPAFDVGGTIHLILNNQVGFTTGADQARSARTSADMAKLTETPILHVNGDDPDAILRAGAVAVAYRQRFARDIVVELLGYRRKGHNEIDEPRFTQPALYRSIDALAPLSQRYASSLAETLDLSAFSAELDAAFDTARTARPNAVPAAPGLIDGIEAQMKASCATGLPADTLKTLGQRITHYPAALSLHPKVAAFMTARQAAIQSGQGIDWATAEVLAMASLLDQGTPVRLTGQDSVRGAFTQRHLDLHCQASDRVHNALADAGFSGAATIANSPLTETAVLAFEYGYSIDRDGLQIWEAQFGDFLNVAQPIFDQFITCGEDRWLFRSNLVLLLPHGVDGGGPDHATAHPERLLSACARGNLQVVNCSTPANYFHTLRRQVCADWRKPLVVLAPKTLLRHPGARSSLAEFEGCFRPVISESRPARRVVASTGKLSVLLQAERDRTDADVALLRLEQLYPLDHAALADAVAPYRDAELVWAQEEPENMGYFNWLDRRLEAATGRRWSLVSRAASPSASYGPKAWDDQALSDVIARALGTEDANGPG